MSARESDVKGVLAACDNTHCRRLSEHLADVEDTHSLSYEDYAYPLRHHSDVLVGKCETPTRTLYTAHTPGDYFTTATLEHDSGEIVSFVEKDRVVELHGMWLEYGLQVVSRESSPFKPIGDTDA